MAKVETSGPHEEPGPSSKNLNPKPLNPEQRSLEGPLIKEYTLNYIRPPNKI